MEVFLPPSTNDRVWFLGTLIMYDLYVYCKFDVKYRKIHLDHS